MSGWLFPETDAFRPRLPGIVFPGAMALIAACALYGAGCQKAAIREAVPTGVEITELQDGRLEFRATARASEAAIASGNYVKKQNTSCGAARLLMQNAYRDRGFGTVDYAAAEFFMIYEAEYCRIIIIR
ncbi:MAG: hypothetical protein RIF32_19190 [Leptospirales bacterium]